MPEPMQRPRLFPYLVVILGVHSGLLAWSAWRTSPVWDEPGHLASGISHWRLGRFELMRVNPPLVRMVAAIPVLWANPVTDWRHYDSGLDTRAERLVGDDFMAQNGARAIWFHTLGRWACIPFSLIGALSCYLFARRLYGNAAGLVAMTLWCTCPNILGNAALVTPNAAAAAFAAAAAYAFLRWLESPGWRAASLAGVILGLAQLTKTTLVICLPIWIIIYMYYKFNKHVKGLEYCGRRGIAQLSVILSLAVYIINAAYGFEGSFERLGDYRFLSRTLGGLQHSDLGQRVNRFSGTPLARLPVPLPRDYVLGIDLQKLDFEIGKWSFLRGEWHYGGWWYFYLYALAIKVPLGTLALFGLSSAMGLSRLGHVGGWRHDAIVLLPLSSIAILVSSQTGFSHHFRYILPVLPFVFVWASRPARSIDLHHRGMSVLVTVLVGWSVASSLWVYPHSLSYFNELVGGPRNGHDHLNMSNIDFGQDLVYLRRWLDNHPEARPLRLTIAPLAVEPGAVGIETAGPPGGVESFVPGPDGSLHPASGWYAVSVNELHLKSRRYDYLRMIHPYDRVGYSILIFHF